MFKHDHPFDPTYGYSLKQLLEVDTPPGPDDFEAFWRETFDQAMAIDLRLQTRQIDCDWPGVMLYEVDYDSWDGVRVGGWMTVPTDPARIERGVVVGHGYGGREAPDRHRHADRQVTIMPCARGFHRSACDKLPNEAHFHVVHGIESRETYMHRGCVVDYWLAGSALLQLYPQCASCLDYEGGSFGGGIGALMLPWDHRIRRGFLSVPSFGNHPLRVTLDCVGSGAAVKACYDQHPEVMETLAYHDAATASRYTTIPVYYDCARFDPAVPPPGQFAVFNAKPDPKEIHVRESGHYEHPIADLDHQGVAVMLDEFFGMRGG